MLSDAGSTRNKHADAFILWNVLMQFADGKVQQPENTINIGRVEDGQSNLRISQIPARPADALSLRD